MLLCRKTGEELTLPMNHFACKINICEVEGRCQLFELRPMQIWLSQHFAMLGKRGRDAGEQGDGSGEGSKEKSEQTNPSKRIKVEEESGPRPEAEQAPVTGEWRKIEST